MNPYITLWLVSLAFVVCFDWAFWSFWMADPFTLRFWGMLLLILLSATVLWAVLALVYWALE